MQHDLDGYKVPYQCKKCTRCFATMKKFSEHQARVHRIRKTKLSINFALENYCLISTKITEISFDANLNQLGMVSQWKYRGILAIQRENLRVLKLEIKRGLMNNANWGRLRINEKRNLYRLQKENFKAFQMEKRILP